MPSDLHRMIRDAGPPRVPELELDEIARRARRWRVQRAVMSASTAIVVVAAGAGAWAARPDPTLDRAPVAPVPGYCPAQDHDVAVYPRTDATDAELDRLQDLLAREKRVRDVTFVSSRSAYEEFKAIYEDDPEFWVNLPKDALPASYRVRLVRGVSAEAMEAAALAFESLPAVDEALTAHDADDKDCRAPDRAARLRERELARYVARIEAIIDRVSFEIEQLSEFRQGANPSDDDLPTMEDAIDGTIQKLEARRRALEADLERLEDEKS